MNANKRRYATRRTVWFHGCCGGQTYLMKVSRYADCAPTDDSLPLSSSNLRKSVWIRVWKNDNPARVLSLTFLPLRRILTHSRPHQAQNADRALIMECADCMRTCNKFQTGWTGWTGFECWFVLSCQSCSSRPLCLRPASILDTQVGRRTLEPIPSQIQICVNPCESVSEKMITPRASCHSLSCPCAVSSLIRARSKRKAPGARRLEHATCKQILRKFQTGFTGCTGFECRLTTSCQSCSSSPL